MGGFIMNIKTANKLQQLRKEKGYTQESLADALGISRQAVSKWERAEASPDTDNLICLAKLYGISIDELLDCENSYKKPMPLDMINKFVGLDSRILHQDTVVQKQAFDQSYKNFWSFVDFNMKYTGDELKDINTCSHSSQ